MHRFVGLSDGFLVRSAHETEGFPLFQVHVRGMSADAELRRGCFQGVKLGQELLFSQFAGGETAFGFVVRINVVLQVFGLSLFLAFDVWFFFSDCRRKVCRVYARKLDEILWLALHAGLVRFGRRAYCGVPP